MLTIEIDNVQYRMNRYGVVFAPEIPISWLPGWVEFDFAPPEIRDRVLDAAYELGAKILRWDRSDPVYDIATAIKRQKEQKAKMAKRKSFTVSLNPAERSEHCVRVKYDMRNPSKRITFEASSTQEVVAIVTRLAKEDGRSLCASVSLTDPKERKPSGFDAATRHLYFNLPEPPATIN
jgi:hypothetical protein